MKKVKSIQTIKTIIIFLVVTLFLNTGISFANSVTFDKVGIFGNRNEILKNTDDTFPANKWPFNEESISISSVGIDTLYGEMKSLTKYLGEVPKDKSEDSLTKKFRTAGSYLIDGDYRPWLDSSSAGYHGLDISEINGDYAYETKEWHLLSLPKTSGAGVDYLLYLFMYMIYIIASLPLQLITAIKGIDIWSIFDLLDNENQVSKMFNSLFLMDQDTGIFSPFLIFMLAAFIISLVFVILKVNKGENAFALIGRELGFFILSMLIASLSIINGSSGGNKLGRLSTDLADKMSNLVAVMSTEEGVLYTYNTGNPNKDTQETQKALLKKPTIDMIIEMQFGTKIEKLDINEENFGRSVNEALEMTFNRSESSYNNFIVSNGSMLDGPNQVNNLGYYWWCANSSVNEKEPINDNSLQSGTPDRILYIVDFLNNVRKLEASSDNNPIILNRVDNIMSSFNKPRYWSGILPMFLLSLLSLAESYSLLLIVLFLSIGKIIVTLGAFLVPVLPGLYLFEKTRETSKKLLKTYISGFARLIIGLIMYNIVFSILAIVTKEGIIGILLGIILCIAIGKLVPRIIIEITRIISRNETDFMSPINSGIIDMSDSIRTNRRERKARRRESGGYRYSSEYGLEREDERLEREKREEEELKVRKGLEQAEVYKEINNENEYKIRPEDIEEIEKKIIEEFDIEETKEKIKEELLEKLGIDIEKLESEDSKPEIIDSDKAEDEEIPTPDIESKDKLPSNSGGGNEDTENVQQTYSENNEIIEDEKITIDEEEKSDIQEEKIKENKSKKKNNIMANLIINAMDRTTVGNIILNNKHKKDMEKRKSEELVKQKIKEEQNRIKREKMYAEAEANKKIEISELFNKLLKEHQEEIVKKDTNNTTEETGIPSMNNIDEKELPNDKINQEDTEDIEDIEDTEDIEDIEDTEDIEENNKKKANNKDKFRKINNDKSKEINSKSGENIKESKKESNKSKFKPLDKKENEDIIDSKTNKKSETIESKEESKNDLDFDMKNMYETVEIDINSTE